MSCLLSSSSPPAPDRGTFADELRFLTNEHRVISGRAIKRRPISQDCCTGCGQLVDPREGVVVKAGALYHFGSCA